MAAAVASASRPPTVEEARAAAAAIGAAHPDVARVAHRHDIGALLKQVESASPHRELSEIIRAASVSIEEMSAWHVKANYANDVEQQWADAGVQLPGMVQLAHDMAVHARGAFTAAGGSHLLCQEIDEALAVLRREAPPLTGAEIV